MRYGPLCLLLAFACTSSGKAASDESPLTVAQKLFDAMKAHDSGGAGALFLPGATLASVDAQGKPSVISAASFLEHIGQGKGSWLERIWDPKVLEHNSIAVVWAEYDFHLNGKFSHCGVDSFSMVKTSSGWKIAAISDTRETSGCKPSPLGPPPAP